jgi:hypothetical protein
MSRFDPKKQHKDAIDWSALAWKTADEDKAAETFVIGLVAGTAIASVTTPLLGGVIGAYFIIKGIQRAATADKNKKYIRSTGCVAHVLDGGNFRAYRSQVGDDAIIEELEFAEQEGLAFSGEALDFWEDYQEQAIAPKEIASTVAVQETRLQVPMTALQSKTQIDYYDPIASTKIDVVNEMTDRISNTIIVGIPGSGKGMLVSNAIREAKRKHPNLKVFVVDPKADPKELEYYSKSCDIHKLYPCMDAKPATVAAWAEAAFDEYAKYAQANERTLLIVDEGTMLGNKLQQARSTLLIDKLTAYTSGGDSAGRNVWFIMQSPYVGGASLNLGTTSQMTSIVIAFRENIGAIAQWKSAKIFKQLSLDEVSELIEQSETGRAFYYGKTGKWYMMPPLKNYSGYDRDNRSYLPGFKAQSSEKMVDDVETVHSLEDRFSDSPEILEDQEENIQDTVLTDHEQMLLSWIITRKTTGKEYDLNSANKNLDKLVKPDDFDSKAEYLRHLARQLSEKNKGKLVNPNLFEPT